MSASGSALVTSAEITGGNKASQVEGAVYITESIVTGSPDHYQVDVLDGANNILPLITAGSDLLDVAGPVGPGDLTWGFQWDATLATGGVLIISKKKNIVPEPTALALLTLGGVALLRRKLR